MKAKNKLINHPIKTFAIILACLVASTFSPITAVVYLYKNKEWLFHAWHPFTPVIEPIYVGITWPYLLAVKKKFIKPFGPTKEELDLRVKKAILKAEAARKKRRAPALALAKAKESKLRKRYE